MADQVRPEVFFRERYGVSAGALERVLGSALARHADDGDLYFEFCTTEALSLEEGQVKKANKERFKKAIADTTPVIPDSWVCQKCETSIPAAMTRCQNCDLGMSAEDIQDMDEEAASELCEAEQIADQDVPEEIHGVLREVVYIPMTENQWFFLLKLDAKINRLLRLHGADNVPEDRDA